MYSERDLPVYAGIYDIVRENLLSANKNFEYSKDTFLCDVMSHPQDVCVSKYLNLSNKEFAEAIYVAAFKRLPEQKWLEFWEAKYQEPRETFQKEVLRQIANSTVVAINQVHFVDNPYFEQKRGIRYHFLGMLYSLTDKSILREFGKKMPAPIQRVIRKVFL